MSMEKVFEALKFSPSEIKVLKHIVEHEQSTSIDIQRAESMKQELVSLAVKKLIKKRYLQITKVIPPSTKKGGRPPMVYSLTKDVYKVMADDLKAIVADVLDKSDSYTSLIEELLTMKKL